MKLIYIYITILSFCIPIIGRSQTYIQGKDAIPFSKIATNKYLNKETQISLEEALVKRKEIEGVDFKETITQLRGEYYLVDGILTSLNCSDLSVLRKNKYPGIYSNYLYLKQDYDPRFRYLMYNDLGTHKVMISYSKKSKLLFYYIENETYSIMGTLYAPNNKINEAQKLIEKLAKSISFKK